VSARLTAVAGKPELDSGLRSAMSRGAYALVVLAVVGFGVLAARYHGALRGELTESTVTRRTALAQLAAATLSERLERMTDLARSFPTRVRFAELVAAGFLDTVAKIGLYWVLTNRAP